MTTAQKQLTEVARALEQQRNREVRLTLPGFIGLGLLAGAVYLLWGRR